MPVPDVTHLQYLLLVALLNGERTGRELRGELEQQGQRKSGPAFYQLMARMEDAKLVTGRYDQKIIEGQIIKERVYTITGSGAAAVADVDSFFAGLMARRGLGLQGA